MPLTIQIIKGEDLPYEEARNIMKMWAKIFHEKLDLKNIEFIDNEIFFILRKKDNSIVALGSLRSVKIKFLEKIYPISGIQGVFSLQKGKGHGTIITEQMKHYLKKHNLMGIGLCVKEVTPFYKKCNFLIKKGFIKRFAQKDKKGNFVPNYYGHDDIVYINDKYHLIDKITAHPRAKAYIPFWW